MPADRKPSRRELALQRSLELKAQKKVRAVRERMLWRMSDPGAFGPDRGAGVPLPGDRTAGPSDEASAPCLPPLPGRGWPFGGA